VTVKPEGTNTVANGVVAIDPELAEMDVCGVDEPLATGGTFAGADVAGGGVVAPVRSAANTAPAPPKTMLITPTIANTLKLPVRCSGAAPGAGAGRYGLVPVT